jgi:Hint module
VYLPSLHWSSHPQPRNASALPAARDRNASEPPLTCLVKLGSDTSNCVFNPCATFVTFSADEDASTACDARVILVVGSAGALNTASCRLGSSSADGPSVGTLTANNPIGGNTNDGNLSEGSSCFPASATVEHESGRFVRMDALEVGDRVRVGPGSSRDSFSDVFMFTHRAPDSMHSFVRISTASGDVLTVSDGHYIYIDGALVLAGSATPGNIVELNSGDATIIVAAARVSDRGLYNPQTAHGDIVVNNVRASTYTSAVAPSIAHICLAPLRALYSLTGFSTKALDGGGHASGAWLLAAVAELRSDSRAL